MLRFLFNSLRAVVLCTIFSDGLSVVAAPVVFTLDPAKSSITISGTVLGSPLQAQAAGSLTSSFIGTINTDLTDSTIQFTGGSVIDAQVTGNWEPMANGDAGTAPADFGARVSNLFAAAKAALREIVVDATSDALPLANGSFGSTGVVFGFATNRNSALDYVATGLFSAKGRLKLSGYSTNRLTSAATLVSNAGALTMDVPVNADFFLTLLSQDDVKLTLTGKLVATASTTPPLEVDPATISVANGAVSFQWQAPPGQSFTVEGSLDFKTWTTRAQGITSANGTYTWSGAAAGSDEFFRLVR